MKKFREYLLILIFLLLILIPLILYFYISNGTLSRDVNDWIAFGTIWGSVFSGISILLLVYENIKNKKNQLFQKVIEIHDIQIKIIKEHDTRKKIHIEEGTESVHSGKDTYFSYFNNLMKDELKKGIVSFLYGVLERHSNSFLDDENLMNFFFNYIADQIEIHDEIIEKYFETKNTFTQEEKKYIYNTWNNSNKEKISKSYIHTIAYPKDKDSPKGMNIIIPKADENFVEYLKNYKTYEQNLIKELYTEAFENVTIITEELLQSFFIAHKNAVISLKKDKDKLFDYFQILTPAEKKAITYYLIIHDNYNLSQLHINNGFYNIVKFKEHKYILENEELKKKFYFDRSKIVYGINDLNILIKLLTNKS